ncbi:efflux RND transporter permease subunit, partial [bacterium]|nr:efflux RND transporter permease subunit [bacterium]
GVDKNIVQLNVQKRLNRVEDLPDDAEEPVLKALSSDDEQPIMWIFVRPTDPEGEELDPFEVFRFCDEHVLKRFERLTGVGDVWLFGGTEREIRIVVDYERLSAYSLTVDDVRQAVQRQNLNARGGPLERGKRRETARVEGQFRTVAEIKDVIVAYRDGRPITIGDFAVIRDSFKEQRTAVRQNGLDTVVLAILRRTGSNTLDVVQRVEDEIARVNEGVLGAQGLELHVVYKDSTYIRESIQNVWQNLGIGAVLATAVLLLFLRSARSTVIIGITIPISLIGTFIFVRLLGRTLNIVSLAGLGFAVGMVVDNAIVVLENCFRHMEEGEDRATAARRAGGEVWGAVLSSTLTTMAVFLPVVFLEVEAGQLFKDIAITVAFAVGMSLIVSITVIPMLCSHWLRVEKRREGGRRGILYWVCFAWLGAAVYGALEWFADWSLRGTVRKIVILVAIAAPCAAAFTYLVPKLDYLPAGNRDLIFGMVWTPPGSNMDYIKARCLDIEAISKRQPETDEYFTVALMDRDSSFMGVRVAGAYDDPKLKDPFVQRLMMEVGMGVPGLRPPGALLFKMPVFREAMGGKSVELTLSGGDIRELAALSDELQGQLMGVDGAMMVKSSLDLGNPERRIVPDRTRCADLGFSVSDVSDVIQTLVGGSIIDIYREKGNEYDITLIGHDRAAADDERVIRTEQDLENIILQTRDGRSVTLRDLAKVVYTVGPTKVEHLDQERSVTLTVHLMPTAPLQSAVGQVQENVLGPLRERLPSGYMATVRGSANRLQETLDALGPSLILAVLITYLLMASLFESFVYPFVIMFAVPLSWAGAFVGMRVLGMLYGADIVPGNPEFNVITLLGFVILTGVVVNNAILIVHQALHLRRSRGMPQNEAISQAVRQRIRPIFMSTTTSVLGMLPLAIGGGSGTELYTGIGAAVVGGLLLSTLFTLVLVPSS